MTTMTRTSPKMRSTLMKFEGNDNHAGAGKAQASDRYTCHRCDITAATEHSCSIVGMTSGIIKKYKT